MILVTERDALAAAMGRVAGIIESKQIVPILGNVMLTAQGDILTIRANNGDMESMESIPAAVGVEGETTVPADKLGEIARGLSAGAQVSFKLDVGRLEVKSGRSRFVLGTLPTKSFPQLWTDEFTDTLTLDVGELKAMLETVEWSQGKEAGRPILMGVRAEEIEGRLRLVGINGLTMSLREGPEVQPFESSTIPTRMVAEMISVLGQTDAETATLGFSERKVMLGVGEAVITSKLIDRSIGFAPYMVPVPKDPAHSARVDIDQATRAVRRASLAAQLGKARVIYLKFSSGALGFKSKNSEAEADDEIDALYDGPDIDMSLDPTAFLNLLGHLNGTVAEVEFTSKKQATIWRAVDDADGFSLIMPLRF